MARGGSVHRPREERWLWLLIAGALLVLRGPAFLANLRPRPDRAPDFFQEYSSARNWAQGLPVYTELDDAVRRYLGREVDHDRSSVFINAHPPAAVLLALPFSRMAFDRAFLAWNVASLLMLAACFGIVTRQLGVPFSAWSVGPVVVLLLLCHPLWEQLRQGQLSLILLFLITGTWAAERSGRPLLAGMLLGTALSIKLIPGFLLLYYVWRGQWRVVASGLGTLALVTLSTATLFGLDAYRTYLQEVLPEVQRFRAGWDNLSLWGFWSRLLDPGAEQALRFKTAPLVYSPLLARILIGASVFAVAGVVAWATHPGRPREENDMTFGMATIAMVLISPIAWDHYFLLLLVPVVLCWLNLPASRPWQVAFFIIVGMMWSSAAAVLSWSGLGDDRAATPIASLGVFPVRFYALLGLFVLAASLARTRSIHSYDVINKRILASQARPAR